MVSRSKLIITTGIGTLFESFDFYFFSLFIIKLNHSFFGNKNIILWFIVVSSIAYLSRIFGAMLFGYWGDKYGRIFAFKRTIFIMAISSIIIGFIPSYESIGAYSIALLMTIRFIQGISYGGEQPGATIIIIERFQKHQALLILCLSVMVSIGIYLAYFTYYSLSSLFTYYSIDTYGWRISYIIIGLIFIHFNIYAYHLRSKMNDSKKFKINKRKRVYKNPIYITFITYKLLLLFSVFTLASIQIYISLFTTILPKVMSLKYNTIYITSYYYYIMAIGVIIGNIVGALLANKIQIRIIYSIGTILTCAAVTILYSIFHISTPSITYFYIFLFIISFFHGVPGVLYLLQISKRIPISLRYTIVSLSFAISGFLFIGIPISYFSFYIHSTSINSLLMILILACILQLIAVQLFYMKTNNVDQSLL